MEQSRQRVAAYIAEETASLLELAKQASMPMLAYLLDMVIQESNEAAAVHQEAVAVE